MRVPRPLLPPGDGTRVRVVRARTVAEAVERLAAALGPFASARILDADARLRPHVNVYVNGHDIRFLDGESTAVGDDDEVNIVPAIAGG